MRCKASPARLLAGVWFCVFVLFIGLSCTAQAQEAPARGYRALRIPPQWRFEQLTPAYEPETGKHLGDFQPGIRVDVIGADPQADTWRVRYVSYGSAPVEADIPWPDLSAAFAARWHLVREDLDKAELIDAVLSGEEPWPDSIAQMGLLYLKGQKIKLDAGTEKKPQRILAEGRGTSTLWGMRPVFVAIEKGPDGRPVINVEVWNKAEGLASEQTFPGRSVNSAYHLLRERLESLSRHLEGNLLSGVRDTDNVLSIVREQRTAYPLANRTQALLRYQRGEYLILELRPFDPPLPGAQTNGGQSNEGRLSRRLRQHVADAEGGYRYISGIPMVNQGDKGYCVAATIARVMQYYGYQVDMHQMASLADTEKYGTSYRDMVSAMRRVCNTTPYRFRQIRSREREEMARLSIERGMPLVWLVPGHVRLLIGFNSKTDEIVYSDSWGPGHEFKTMPWGDFIRMTVDLFLIDVGDS